VKGGGTRWSEGARYGGGRVGKEDCAVRNKGSWNEYGEGRLQGRGMGGAEEEIRGQRKWGVEARWGEHVAFS